MLIDGLIWQWGRGLDIASLVESDPIYRARFDERQRCASQPVSFQQYPILMEGMGADAIITCLPDRVWPLLPCLLHRTFPKQRR